MEQQTIIGKKFFGKIGTDENEEPVFFEILDKIFKTDINPPQNYVDAGIVSYSHNYLICISSVEPEDEGLFPIHIISPFQLSNCKLVVK